MAEPPSIALSQPQKRPFEDDAPPPVSTPTKAPPSSNSSSPLTVLSTVPSPFSVKNGTPQTAPPSSSAVNGGTPAPTGSHPAKRRKLTEQEKEEKKLEQEAKEKAKAEKKAQREEEQRIRDEEKRKRNEEREEKKRAKDLAQQQKEEEKRKREQAQPKLNMFFSKKPADARPDTTVETTNKSITSEPISLATDHANQGANSGPSPQKAIQKNAQGDYHRTFLPFEPPPCAIVAPHNRFMEDADTRQKASSRLDELIASGGHNSEPIQLLSFKAKFPARGPRGRKTLSIAEIVERINGSSNNPIDLTDNVRDNRQQPLEQLKCISMKYLHFPEDVRPPYYGTYTRSQSTEAARKLARCPFTRNLQETNYDYDSEAEWEEPQEGDEDLESDVDEDLDDDADEDMDGFLDDEDDPHVKRRLHTGDQEPISTGVCWEDAQGVSRLNDGSGAICNDFKGFKLGFLLTPLPQSIDPFSTAYWAPDPSAVTSVPTLPAKDNGATRMMNPPRLPLTQRPANGMLNTLMLTDKTNATGGAKPSKLPKKPIPENLKDDFKKEIHGSPLTKIAMIEHLKAKFPKLTKDAITHELARVAGRVGTKENEKFWVVHDEA